MRKGLITCLVAVPLLLSATATGSHRLSIHNFDFQAAERNLRNLRHTSKNLHEAELRPDGSRGFGLPNPQAARAAFPTPPPPPFSTELEWTTYYTYCAWDVIVRAIHLDSTPILTSDKTLIYTLSRFAVVETIRSDVPLTPGQQLVAYRVGGEVVDRGERLRIDTPDMAPFEPQKTYILQLRRDKDASAQQYSIAQGLTVEVSNGKIKPIAGEYAWLTGADAFPLGAPYDEVRSTFLRVSKLKSCPESR